MIGTCREIDLYPLTPRDNLSNMVANEEWDVLGMTLDRKERKFDGAEFSFPIVTATITIKRRYRYYLVNLVFPSIAISVVAIIGFFTPGSSGDDRTEKVNLGMATLLAKSVLLIIIADIMPVTSAYQPLIGILFIADMVLLALGVVITCVIMEVQRNTSQSRLGPRWRRLFFVLAPALCLELPRNILLSRRETSPPASRETRAQVHSLPSFWG